MKLLEETPFLTAFYSEEHSLFQYHWKSENSKMRIDEYKKIMTQLIQYVVQYQIRRVVADMRDSEFIIVPALQAWNAEHVFKVGFEAQMREVAFLLKEELIQKLSVEQMTDEAKEVVPSDVLQIKFFATLEAAYSWLGIRI